MGFFFNFVVFFYSYLIFCLKKNIFIKSFFYGNLEIIEKVI